MSFELEITEQGWLEAAGDWNPERHDLCSHGDLRLVIGGEVIAAPTASTGRSRTGTAASCSATSSKNETGPFAGLALDLGEDEYRSVVVAFAETAKEPFAAVEKSLDESTRTDYEAFWREYDERLGRASTA